MVSALDFQSLILSSIPSGKSVFPALSSSFTPEPSSITLLYTSPGELRIYISCVEISLRVFASRFSYSSSICSYRSACSRL